MKILKIDLPRSIRCNTLKISPEKLKQRLEKNYNWIIKQPFENFPEIMIVEGKTSNSDNQLQELSGGLGGTPKLENLSPGELGRSLEHLLGYYYIQEIASMLPVLALNPKPNETILDLCSSPGSKTTQIASKMQNTGTLIANEVSQGRINILSANLSRCGCSNTIITKKDGMLLCNELEKQKIFIDKILVDAPCSGEGTIRSTPATNKMWNPKTITRLSKIQKNLVASALKILKPNGILIYSTCTHAPEENEAILDYMKKEFDVEVEEIKLPVKCRKGITNWQDKKFSQQVKKACRVYPQDNNTEGFFISKIRKLK